MGAFVGHGAVTIFSGNQLIVQRGDDGMCNLLPRGVHNSIEKVHREQSVATQLEIVIVEFKNGHHAKMYLMTFMPDPVDDDLLKEFQATCLMIHDL